MNRNTTATVGQAQRVDQTDGKCIRHPRTNNNLGGELGLTYRRLGDGFGITVGSAVGKIPQAYRQAGI